MIQVSPTAEAEYVQKRLEALQPVVSEPVLGALALNRRGLYTQKILGRAGFLPYLVARAWANSAYSIAPVCGS